MDGGRQVVAIDFDGTLYTPVEASGRPSTPDEISTAKGTLNELVAAYAREAFDRGHFVVVYTARPHEDRWDIERWLRRMGVPFDCVRCGKLRYDTLVDDRALRPDEVSDGQTLCDKGRSTSDQAV